MASHLVIGYGPTGVATARLLVEQGHAVKVVSRSERASESEIEHLALDATNSHALSRAAMGVSAIYNCANPAYHRWVTDWPPLATAMNDAAEASGAVLVVLNNLYSYGPVTGKMTEDLPLVSTGVKGQVRAKMSRQTFILHEEGRLRAVEVRASDFFGPGVTDGGHLASRAMPALLKGRPVQAMGDPDSLHSWTYVPDVARTLVKVADEEQSWGQVWHVPTAPALSLRTMVEKLTAEAKLDMVSVRQIPPILLRTLSLFSPLLRELHEVRYQFDRPFILDSRKFTERFGLEPTPIDEQVKETVAWWRQRLRTI